MQLHCWHILRHWGHWYLSFARQRFRNGQIAFNSPSRFLNDIDRRFFELNRPAAPKAQRVPSIPSIPSVPSTPKVAVSGATTSLTNSEWKSGDRVTHRVFGDGTVVRVYRDEVTENDKIEINFDKQGTKTLLLTHAKLERL